MIDVIHQYDLSIERVIPFSLKDKRKVWKLYTRQGEFALKALDIPPRRVRFLTAAHEHLLEASDLVPYLLPTREGEPYGDDGKMRYIVVEWVPGQALSYKNMEHTELLFRTLARFHRASRGFTPPAGTNPRDYLGKWPERYEERMRKLSEFFAVAKKGRRPFDSFYLKAYPTIYQKADEACRILEKSSYHEWCSDVLAAGGFIHGDFGCHNTTRCQKKAVVYDLDGLAVDLPAADLRILINHMVKTLGFWNTALMQRMLACYQSKIPLDEGQKQVLLADLMFPHKFYVAAKKSYLTSPSSLKRRMTRMKRAASIECRKTAAALANLYKGIGH